MTLPALEPIADRILANVETALAAITTSHATASFWNEVRYTYRGNVGYPNLDGYPACVVWIDQNLTRDNVDSQIHSLNDERLEIQIDGFIEERSNVARSLQRLAFDIRTALMLDSTRGQLAIHTFIGSQRFFHAIDIAEPISKVEVDVSVTYRTRVEDLTISN